jgi:hypothetical protein
MNDEKQQTGAQPPPAMTDIVCEVRIDKFYGFYFSAAQSKVPDHVKGNQVIDVQTT